jgi:hypothetical protein
VARIEPGSLDELRTERLVLRRPTPSDRDDLLRLDAERWRRGTPAGAAR